MNIPPLVTQVVLALVGLVIIIILFNWMVIPLMHELEKLA